MPAAHARVPDLPYRPREPNRYRPNIGLIACGQITRQHLNAYKSAGYRVVALCDPCIENARARRDEFYPHAQVYSDHRELLARDDIEVVDIAAHPNIRPALVQDALLADKHVLSQKPFVLTLDEGEALVELAEKRGLRLAVNQNARWAPHYSYVRCAIAAGLLGQVGTVQLTVCFDHNWIVGTPFDHVRHIILYDYAIHHFDLLATILPGHAPKRVFASITHSPGQRAAPALLGQAIVEYDHAQANLFFNGNTLAGKFDQTVLIGSSGTIISTGPDHQQQTLALHTPERTYHPHLLGEWFPDGFHGAMAELLCAIEDDREPENNARDNLRSLELCFAAVASAESGRPCAPGAVRKLPG